MGSFSFYLNFGFNHILDIDALDHIAFLVALCAIYHPRQWRKILILITAFTIGHSITLALAASDLIFFNKKAIELLIPLTIFITALHNILLKNNSETNTTKGNYLMALAFGFIHGMGFSNTLKTMMMPGEKNTFLSQLLAFNIGVELGQIVIVGIILIITYIVLSFLKWQHRDWNIFVSGIAAGTAIVLFLAQV